MAATAWRCAEHGDVVPLWRSPAVTYEDLATLLVAGATHPAYLPWPISPGWRISDAGLMVGRLDGIGQVRGTMTACSGPSEEDGPVEVMLVAEEPGAGLGGSVAGLGRVDPGPEVGDGPATARVRVGPRTVALWQISTTQTGEEADRAVFAGEALGRWLWLVLRPASAALLLSDTWILRDLSTLGPPLLEVPFGGPAPSW